LKTDKLEENNSGDNGKEKKLVGSFAYE